jgi:transcriptional regulator with XRE-family HTH domain
LANLDEKAEKLYQEVMRHCRQQRKSQTALSVREVASRLEVTENYLSSIENGREFVSFKTFLKYLMSVGFDTSTLMRLAIDTTEAQSPDQKERIALAEKIYSFDNQKLALMVEQAKLVEKYGSTKSKKNIK